MELWLNVSRDKRAECVWRRMFLLTLAKFYVRKVAILHNIQNLDNNILAIHD